MYSDLNSKFLLLKQHKIIFIKINHTIYEIQLIEPQVWNTLHD